MSESAKFVEFSLEILAPGDTEEPIVSIRALQSFAPFQVGDLVNLRAWGEIPERAWLVRVVNVEHILWPTKDGLLHRTCLFTEEAEDTREARFQR